MQNRTPKKQNDLAERAAEATEKETVKDLEQSFGSADADETDNQSVPSPDGSFDEGNELEPADPM